MAALAAGRGHRVVADANAAIVVAAHHPRRLSLTTKLMIEDIRKLLVGDT